MFDRFGVGSPPMFGVRGGIVAVSIHAFILVYGLGVTTRDGGAAAPYQAPESILVMTQAPQRVVRSPIPTIPVTGPIDVHFTGDPILIRWPPAGPMAPGPVAIPEEPVVGWPTGDSSGVYESNLVEQPPELLSSPPPRYPELLRAAHVEGVVVVQGVVDTLGHLEPRTLQVIESPHPALSTSAVESLERAVFRPGRVEGRAVRVLVRVPVQFSIGAR